MIQDGLICLKNEGCFYKHEMLIDRWGSAYGPYKHGLWAVRMVFKNATVAILLKHFSPVAFGVIDDFGNWVKV